MSILDDLKRYKILSIEENDGEIEILDPKDDKYYMTLKKADILQLSQELKAYVER